MPKRTEVATGGDARHNRRFHSRPFAMFSHLFRSLHHPQFRVFYFAQLISITGTWMQNMAQAWLVYRLTHSSLLLGTVAFAGLLPVLLFGLWGGVLADRWPRRTLLIAAQIIAAVQASVLATLVLGGWVATWHIIILAFVLGVVHAMEMPSRHSLLAELVPPPDLANAIALNSSLFNLARFFGPAIAGWLVTAYGEGVVFLINALTFISVLLALLTITAGSTAPDKDTRGQWRRLLDGLHYAWSQRTIRTALMLLAISSLTAPSYAVLMPVFAHRVFHGGASELGLLLGTAGAGALLAAMRLAYLGGRQSIRRHIGTAAMAAGAGMMLFAHVSYLPIALPVVLLLGFSATTLVASVNTLLQMQVPNQLRGRVMSLFAVLFVGVTSLGSMVAGVVAEHFGIAVAVTAAGACSLLAGTLYGLRSAD